MLQCCFCFYVFGLWPRGMWALSSPTRNQPHTLCLERWSLNHWNSREVFFYSFKNYYTSFRCLAWWFYTIKHYEMIMAIKPVTTHNHTKSLSHYWPCFLCVHYTLMTLNLYLEACTSYYSTSKIFLGLSYTVQSQSLGYIAICVCVCVFSHIWIIATPWIVAHQVPLSMGFSRQEYWTVLIFPPPGDLPNPGIKLKSPLFSALAVRFFTTEPLGKPIAIHSLPKLLKKKQKNMYSSSVFYYC